MYLVSQFDPLGFAQILLLLGSFVFSFIVLFHFVCKCSFNRGTAELGEAGGGSGHAVVSHDHRFAGDPGSFQRGTLRCNSM